MRYAFFVITLVLIVSCKKAEDKRCLKSFGEMSEIEIPLDSTNEFRLSKRIKYNFYQDSLKKVVVRAGKNMLKFIDVNTSEYVTTIQNNNGCNFVRRYDKIVEVDVHYPKYSRIYSESSDSVIFKNTITGQSLSIEIRNGAGVVDIEADVDDVAISVSYGVGSYVLKGRSNSAVISLQNKGRGDATGFSAKNIRIYQNSSNDLKVNLDSSEVNVLLNGNGDILYLGTPDTLGFSGQGDSQFLPL
jgi:hypothetical protein